MFLRGVMQCIVKSGLSSAMISLLHNCVHPPKMDSNPLKTACIHVAAHMAGAWKEHNSSGHANNPLKTVCIHVTAHMAGSWQHNSSGHANNPLKTVCNTNTTQQRPESPMVNLTWHACKYNVHKLHQRYILISRSGQLTKIYDIISK